jgi:stress responsive alpha/beta barrel protein
MRNVFLLAILGVVIATTGCGKPLTGRCSQEPALAHNVYFALNDASPAARAQLVDACYKYLKDHPGVTSFAAGEIVESHDRDVNVRDWDVGLHMVFKSKTRHDLYQEAEDHHKFIEENKANWKDVRVFDTFVR